MEQEKLDREKALGEISNFKEGEGESFHVKITRVSNGYILQGKGNKENHIMVFSEEKYFAAIEWVLSRRLKKLKDGEEMELLLEQRFTKIIKTQPESDTGK